MAAYLWANENLDLLNSETIESAMSEVSTSRIDGYDYQVSCYDSHTVMSKLILICKVGELFKTTAIIDKY